MCACSVAKGVKSPPKFLCVGPHELVALSWWDLWWEIVHRMLKVISPRHGPALPAEDFCDADGHLLCPHHSGQLIQSWVMVATNLPDAKLFVRCAHHSPSTENPSDGRCRTCPDVIDVIDAGTRMSTSCLYCMCYQETSSVRRTLRYLKLPSFSVSRRLK